jgi:hypothetical protein
VIKSNVAIYYLIWALKYLFCVLRSMDIKVKFNCYIVSFVLFRMCFYFFFYLLLFYFLKWFFFFHDNCIYMLSWIKPSLVWLFTLLFVESCIHWVIFIFFFLWIQALLKKKKTFSCFCSWQPCMAWLFFSSCFYFYNKRWIKLLFIKKPFLASCT